MVADVVVIVVFVFVFMFVVMLVDADESGWKTGVDKAIGEIAEAEGVIGLTGETTIGIRAGTAIGSPIGFCIGLLAIEEVIGWLMRLVLDLVEEIGVLKFGP